MRKSPNKQMTASDDAISRQDRCDVCHMRECCVKYAADAPCLCRASQVGVAGRQEEVPDVTIQTIQTIHVTTHDCGGEKGGLSAGEAQGTCGPLLVAETRQRRGGTTG